MTRPRVPPPTFALLGALLGALAVLVIATALIATLVMEIADGARGIGAWLLGLLCFGTLALGGRLLRAASSLRRSARGRTWTRATTPRPGPVSASSGQPKPAAAGPSSRPR